MAACGGSALLLAYADFVVQMMGLSVWVVVYSGLMLFIDRRWADSRASHGEQT